jgi:hypothetical protein
MAQEKEYAEGDYPNPPIEKLIDENKYQKYKALIQLTVKSNHKLDIRTENEEGIAKHFYIYGYMDGFYTTKAIKLKDEFEDNLNKVGNKIIDVIVDQRLKEINNQVIEKLLKELQQAKFGDKIYLKEAQNIVKKNLAPHSLHSINAVVPLGSE